MIPSPYIIYCYSQNSRPIGDRVKSKFRKFKNLFSETEKNTTDYKKDSRLGSHKWKMEAVRVTVCYLYTYSGFFYSAHR